MGTLLSKTLSGHTTVNEIRTTMNNKTCYIILFFVLISFFLRGMFMTAIIPIFFGPDEDNHISTVQYKAELKHVSSGEAVLSSQKYRYSEELIAALEATDFFKVKPLSENIPEFANGQNNGKNEELFKAVHFERRNQFANPQITGYPPLYYALNVIVEKAAFDHDIITRVALMRMIAVSIGALILLCAFFIAREIGLTRAQAVLLTAIISFQPMFSFMSAVVNPDILLIFSFTLFTYASLLLLHHGLKKKAIFLLLLSVGIGLFTKGPAMILPLIATGIILYKLRASKIIHGRRAMIANSAILLCIGGLIFLTPIWEKYIQPYILNTTSHFSSLFNSVSEYLHQTVDYKHIVLQTTISYWGNFGWLDTPIDQRVAWFILGIEILAAVGIIFFLIRKNTIPRKKFDVIFLVGMLFALQLLVRYSDWLVFDRFGRLELNTQGRYFLPNIFAHIYLIYFGLAMLFRRYARMILPLLLIGMIGLYTYSVLFTIIPRFYF